MVRDPRLQEQPLRLTSKVLETDVPSSGRKTIHVGLSAAFWDELIEESPLPSCLKDRTGRYRRTNRAFAQLMQALGRPLADCDDEAFPEFALVGDSALDIRCLQTQETLKSSLVLRGPGKRCRVEVTRIPLSTDALLLTVHERSSGRRAAEDAAQAKSARKLLDCLPEMAWLKDADGAYQAANRAFGECCGRGYADIVGARDDEIWSARIAARMLELERAARAAGVVSREELFADREGMRWLELSATPLYDDEGNFAGTAGWGRDIGHRKQLEERQRGIDSRLEQTQRLESIGLLSGGLAHDINNLLVGILGHAELAVRELKQTQDSPGILQRIQDLRAVTLQASALTQQMLAYSGRAQAVVCAVNLAEIVQQTRSLIESTFSGQVQLDVNIDEDLPAVDAEASELRQIVINLLTNAAEAVHAKGGRVTVHLITVEAPESAMTQRRTGGTESRVRLEVVDSGEGMPKEVVEKIFEPFFSTKPSGRGLGLAAVKRIVDRLNGEIRVHSVPGQGTAVSIELPSSSRGASERAVLEEGPQSEWKGEGELLLVDDQQSVRTVVSLLLRDHGFAVRESASAACALETFRRNVATVRAVLLDLSLPDSGGERVFEELRRMRPELPVLVWSGFEEHDVRERFGSGVKFEFVQKPFSMDALVRRLRNMLESSETS